jgi:uncharacterized protein YbaP (TraB family)
MGIALRLAQAVVVAAACAQAVATGAAAPVREPAIWTIEKANGETITLFGSVHLLPEGKAWRTDSLAAAYAKADVIVLETDLEAVKERSFQTYITENSLNPSGVTLSSLLSAEEKNLVRKAAARAGVSLSQIERFRPWFAALQISVSYAAAQGFSPGNGVDMLIAEDGRRDDKAFDYLEAAREQLDLFIQLPLDEQVSFLVLGARELADRPDELKRLVDAWMAGDVEAIDRFMNAGLEDAPGVASALLDQRNERWVKKIREFYLKDKNSYLIVVGAGHLAGDDSVQAKLRDLGIEVEGP